jgi:Protein of unknown function (DUF4238)
VTGTTHAHYVPQFLLKRFSLEPSRKNPRLSALDIATGAVSRTSVKSILTIKDDTRVTELYGVSSDYVEQTLSDIENMTRQVIVRMANRETLLTGDRWTLALFLVVQYGRTPRSRAWKRFMSQEAMCVQVAESATDAEGESVSHELLEDLKPGNVEIDMGRDREVFGIFQGARWMAQQLCTRMSWGLYEAPDGHEFVISDHPLVMFDPERTDDVAIGWFSPSVEATMPLGRRVCLFLSLSTTPPTPFGRHLVDAQVVRDINLRTYASAEWSIFGSSQAVLQSVRSDAKKRKDLVAMYRPKSPTFNYPHQPDDSDVLKKPIAKRAPKLPRRRT